MRTFDIPETIPLSKVQAFLADLGIDPRHLRELHIGLDGVFVEVPAYDENGRIYVEANGDIALHRIAIRLDREA